MLALVLALAAGSAHAGMVELEPAKDATIWRGGTVNGAGDGLWVGQAGAGAGPDSFRRALIAFDLSSIPSGTTIASATLTLTADMGMGSSAFIETHPLLQDWLEGDQSAGSGQGSFPVGGNDVTWTSTGLAPWTTDGGHFLAADSSIANPPTVFSSFSLSGPALTATVQAWVNGTLDNYGWLLMGLEGSSAQVRRVHSRESLDPSERPRLTITTVPEAGTSLLLTLGLGLGLARERRR